MLLSRVMVVTGLSIGDAMATKEMDANSDTRKSNYSEELELVPPQDLMFILLWWPWSSSVKRCEDLEGVPMLEVLATEQR